MSEQKRRDLELMLKNDITTSIALTILVIPMSILFIASKVFNHGKH